MNPEIWGPPAWIFLHYITLTYPDKPTNEDKEKYKDFFIRLGDVLPCYACSHNYKIHLDKFPLNDKVLSSKKKFVKWLINIHNEVNKINNKKIISTKYFYDKYEELNNYPERIKSCEKYNNLLFYIIIILIVIIIYLIMKKN